MSGSTTIYIGQTYECTGTQCTKYIISGTQIVAQINAAGTYYYHSDHLGSSSIITNASGNKAEDIFYYPYGDRNVESGSISVKYKFQAQAKNWAYGVRLASMQIDMVMLLPLWQDRRAYNFPGLFIM